MCLQSHIETHLQDLVFCIERVNATISTPEVVEVPRRSCTFPSKPSDVTLVWFWRVSVLAFVAVPAVGSAAKMVDRSPIILICSMSVPAHGEDERCQSCVTHHLNTFPVTLAQDRRQLSCLGSWAFAVACSQHQPPAGPAVNNVAVRSSARLRAPSRQVCKKSWQQPSLLQPVA